MKPSWRKIYRPNGTTEIRDDGSRSGAVRLMQFTPLDVNWACNYLLREGLTNSGLRYLQSADMSRWTRLNPA